MARRIISPRRNTVRQTGRLIVFEGPDKSGKSTVSNLLVEELRRLGKKCIWLAFPGHEPGTLGAEIYSLHHDPRFEKVPAISVQLLHVAAHVEALHRRILPALADGTWIVLDRYWWSTWVYGLAAGADRVDLQHALDIERRQWGCIQPALAFLFLRDLPNLKNQPPQRLTLSRLYQQLARREKRNHPVETVRNERSLDDALRQVVATTIDLCLVRR